MPNTNLYQNLQQDLQAFKTFLDANGAALRPAIQALRAILPQISDLIVNLITLLGQLKTVIQGLDVIGLPGLDKVSTFAADAKVVLQDGESLLPDQKSTIDNTIGIADVVSGLPQLGPIRSQILSLIDSIVADLNALKS